MRPISSVSEKGLSKARHEGELEKSLTEKNCLERAEGEQTDEIRDLMESGVS